MDELEYDGNSHKEKDEKSIPVVKIEGRVITKRKPVGSRFRELFFGGDARSATAYVMQEVMFPALRNLIYDVSSKGMEQFIFGESRHRRDMGGGRRSHFTYDKVSRMDDYRNPYYGGRHYETAYERPYRANLPDQNRRPRRRESLDIILTSKREAENILHTMEDIIHKYDVVTVANLYEMLGLRDTPMDNKWGWVTLNGTEIRQVREGFLLDLPPAEEV